MQNSWAQLEKAGAINERVEDGTMEWNQSWGPQSVTVETAEHRSQIREQSFWIITWALTGRTTSHKYTSHQDLW